MAKKPSNPQPKPESQPVANEPQSAPALTPEQEAIAFLTQKYDALYNELRARVDAFAAHHLQTYGKAI